MRIPKEATVDGVLATITNTHHKENGTHFTTKTEAKPKINSKLEIIGRSGNQILPYIVTDVIKIENNRYRIVARVATDEDYE